MLDALHRQLSRVTSSGRFIAEIDGLRFVAIGTVFLFHVQFFLTRKAPGKFAEPEGANWLTTVLATGDYGVHLFFAISGFILALPFAEYHLHQGRQIPLRKYFFRRLTRLEPPYILNLVICYVLAIVINGKDPIGLLPHLAASMIYLHNVAFADGSVINGVAWSLEVEVQFYCLAPLLANVYRLPKWPRRAVLLGAITAFALWQAPVPVDDHSRVQLSILWFAQYFLVGFLLADVYLTEWDRKPQPAVWADPVGIVAWLAMPVVLHMELLEELVFPLLILVAYSCVFRGRLLNALFSNRWIAVIGGMCYTIYLYHFVMISALGRFSMRITPFGNPTLDLLLQVVLLGIPILALCSVLFALFEKPFMYRDWPQRLYALLPVRSVEGRDDE